VHNRERHDSFSLNTMTPEPDKQLEQSIHRELRKLPELSAPPSLLPRVRAAIAARERLPWWQKSWFQWPVMARFASVALIAGFVKLGLFAVGEVGVGSGWLATNPLLDWARAGLDIASTLGNALLTVGRAIPPAYLAVGFVLVVGSYLSCIGLGTVCYRVARSRR
jgi:hypothetical protein